MVAVVGIVQTVDKVGIGRDLFNLARKDHRGIVTVNAMPYGVPVYTHLGFVPTDTQKNENGIIFTPMRYDK